MDLVRDSGQGVVYAGGYAACSDSLKLLLDLDPQILLVDARHWPHSSFAEWDGDSLKENYPSRYRWAGKWLGNTHHASGGPIRLADAVRGIEGLLVYMSQGRRLVLICGCQDYDTCHLRTIVDLLTSVVAVARGREATAGVNLAVVRQILARWGNRPVPDCCIIHAESVTFPGYEKVLSVQEPWAWLITHPNVIASCGMSPKDIENRLWTTRYRGRLLIHTGTKVDSSLFDERGCLDEWFWSSRFGEAGKRLVAAMPRRRADYVRPALVGYADLVDVLDVAQNVRRWSVTGSYGFLLQNAHAFAQPVSYAGKRRIFDVPLASLGALAALLPERLMAE